MVDTILAVITKPVANGYETHSMLLVCIISAILEDDVIMINNRTLLICFDTVMLYYSSTHVLNYT